MLLYCLMHREKADCKNPGASKTNKGNLIILLKCAVCDTKKSSLIKGQKASGLFTSLGVKTPLVKFLFLKV